MDGADPVVGRGLGGDCPSDNGGMSNASTCRVRKPVFAVCSVMYLLALLLVSILCKDLGRIRKLT